MYTHTHTHTHTHTLEYCSAMRKAVLPFVTTLMGFEDVILSQTKANSNQFYMESKRTKLIKTASKMVFTWA